MWSNILSAALRNLIRNGTYSAINVFGLALGFATVMLIAVYVRDEYSFDTFWPQHAQIFRMYEEAQLNGRAPMRAGVTFSTVAGALKADFPEVEDTTRAIAENISLRVGDQEIFVRYGLWVDPNFFEFFPMQPVVGDVKTALQQPEGIVLTRSMARRLFGREDVLGQKITVNRDYTVEVSAVIEDLPTNTHLESDFFLSGVASFSGITRADKLAQDRNALQNENSMTFGRLRPGKTVADINKGMRAFVDRLLPAQVAGAPFASIYNFYALPVADMHFHPRSIETAAKPSGDERVVQAMIGIALLILIVAGSNFVNMMTARAVRRALEVGVRKTLGGSRGQLVAQFLTECVGYTLIAATIGAAGAVALVPQLQAFLQRDLQHHLTPAFFSAILVLSVMIGVLAGAYPALLLSSFRPITVLKGTLFAPTGSGRVRRGLVMLQFAVLITLILGTVTIYRQIDYAIHQRLTVGTDQIYISGLGGIPCNDTLVQRLSHTPGVKLAACTSETALGTGGRFSAVPIRKDGSTDAGFRAGPTDLSFFDIFGVAPLAGRLFSADHGGDVVLRTNPDSQTHPNVVLNAAAARALGFASPQDAVGQALRWQFLVFRPDTRAKLSEPGESEIVGVVPDFSIGSLRDVIEPTIYYVDPHAYGMLVTKIEGSQIAAAVDALQQIHRDYNARLAFRGVFYTAYLNGLYMDVLKQSQIFTVFAGVAVAVACLGLLGLAVFTAERATKEIGLRKAMGASRMDILKFLGWQFVRPVLWANLIAWPLAYLFMRRWLEGFAYHVDIEPAHFVLAALAAVVIALVTVSGHSLIVARARPVTALRYE